jgi:hypothetical protein
VYGLLHKAKSTAHHVPNDIPGLHLLCGEWGVRGKGLGIIISVVDSKMASNSRCPQLGSKKIGVRKLIPQRLA